MNKIIFFSSLFIGFVITLPSFDDPQSNQHNSFENIDFNQLCKGLLFNAIPHPTDQNSFIGCIQERGTVFGCETEDLVFDPSVVQCVDPYAVATTTEVGTTTTRNGGGGGGGGGDIGVHFVCPPSGAGYIPHRDDCTRYFECIRHIAHPRRCSTAGYHFDVVTKQCKPEELALCANIIKCI